MKKLSVVLISLLICLLIAASTVRSASSPPKFQFLRIAPKDEKCYELSEFIKCKDGSKKFTKAQLNNNFCDCVDGTDKPGTSACPNGRFYCWNKGHVPQVLFSSRVNGGICVQSDPPRPIYTPSFDHYHQHRPDHQMSMTTTRHEPPLRSPLGVTDEMLPKPFPISPPAVTTSDPRHPDPTVATKSTLFLSMFLTIPMGLIPFKPDLSWFLHDSDLKHDIPNCYVSDFWSRSSSAPVVISIAIISFRSSSLRLI